MLVFQRLLLWAVLFSFLAFACAPKGQKPIEQVSHDVLLCEQVSHDDFTCDAVQCERAEACCDADKICTENEGICINERLVETCYSGDKPIYEFCESGRICVGGECDDEPGTETRSPNEMARETGVYGEAVYKCDSDEECYHSDLWDGEYCSNRGQCLFKVLRMIEDVTVENLTVELPFYSKYPNASCDCQIRWGDNPKGIAETPQVIDCSKVENRTHVYSKAGSYFIEITDTAKCGEPLE